MKKIRMITFHTPKNYGAVLQAYSLFKCLEEYSTNVKVIDYNTPHLRSLYPIFPKITGFKSLVKFILLLPYYSQIKNKYLEFDEFVKQNLSLTRRFESLEELYDCDWDADIFVTGSDQVFNPNRILEERKAFYLDFAPENSNRISYAGSFGCNAIDTDKKEEISSYLSKFSSISVREKTGGDIVFSLIDEKPTIVLDPVFLHDYSFWNIYEKPYKKQLGRYLLYYRLLSSTESDNFALSEAKRQGLKLVVLGSYFNTMHADYYFRDVGPQEFLYLFSHADFIVTSAFHGVAFSVIYKKQFVFSDTSSLNGRGMSVLEMLHIEDQAYIKSYSEKNKLDYNRIDVELKKEVDKSKQYLKEALNLSGVDFAE